MPGGGETSCRLKKKISLRPDKSGLIEMTAQIFHWF